MSKKLYRSDDNKVLLGICGGIGEYFNIDPVIVRLILLALIFLGFSGIIVYIIAAFIVPKKPQANGPVYYTSSGKSKRENIKIKTKPVEAETTVDEPGPGFISVEDGSYKVNKKLDK